MASMTLPTGHVLAIMGLGLILFVLFFIRRYSDILSTGSFRTLLLATLALSFITVAFIWYFNRPPKDKTRLAIFPVVDSSVNSDSSWMSWAVAGIAAQTLLQTAEDNLLVYPLDWLWEAVSADSLSSQGYVLSYAQRVGLDYIVVGEMNSSCHKCPIQWSLFNVRSQESLASGTIDLLNKNVQSAGVQLARSVGSQLGLKIKSSIESIGIVPNSIIKWTVLAEKAYLQRDFESCIKLAEKAFATDSNYVPVRNLLATAHLNFGLSQKLKGKPPGIHYAIARTLCEKTIKRDSLNATAERILGEYYLLKELWTKADTHLRRALDINPNDARIYRDLSQLHASRYKKLGFRNEKAVLNYAIFLNPCYEEARIQLAKYYYFKQWPSRAEKVINELLAIHPTSVEGLLYLSKIFISQNNILKVLEIGKRAVELAPNNVDAYFNLGVAYYHWEDYENAQAFFQRAVDLDDHINAHLYLAYLYERKGDHAQAIRHLRKRLQLRRDDLYANKARELLYQLTHQDSTDTRYESSITLPPHSDKEGIEVGVKATQF